MRRNLLIPFLVGGLMASGCRFVELSPVVRADVLAEPPPNRVAVSADGHHLYVLERGMGTNRAALRCIDGATGLVVGTRWLSSPGSLIGIAASADERWRAVLLWADGKLETVDPDLRTVAQVSLPDFPRERLCDFDANADTGHFYVTAQVSGADLRSHNQLWSFEPHPMVAELPDSAACPLVTSVRFASDHPRAVVAIPSGAELLQFEHGRLAGRVALDGTVTDLVAFGDHVVLATAPPRVVQMFDLRRNRFEGRIAGKASSLALGIQPGTAEVLAVWLFGPGTELGDARYTGYRALVGP